MSVRSASSSMRTDCRESCGWQRPLRLLGYWLVCVGTLGIQYAFAFIYAQLLDVFDGASPAEAATVGSLSTGLMDGLAALSGLVVQRLGSRRACLLGAFVSA